MSTKPDDKRPNRNPSASGGPERIVIEGSMVVTLRQIGWLGQSGNFYSYEETSVCRNYELGSYMPMWIIAHIDRTDTLPPPNSVKDSLLTSQELVLNKLNMPTRDKCGHLVNLQRLIDAG